MFVGTILPLVFAAITPFTGGTLKETLHNGESLILAAAIYSAALQQSTSACDAHVKE